MIKFCIVYKWSVFHLMMMDSSIKKHVITKNSVLCIRQNFENFKPPHLRFLVIRKIELFVSILFYFVYLRLERFVGYCFRLSLLF